MRCRMASLTALGLLICFVSVSVAAGLEPREALGGEAPPEAFLSAIPAPTLAQAGRYEDVDPDSYAAQPIASLAADGVFEGTDCAPNRFCPGATLPRWVMAVWVVRIVDGQDPPTQPSRFVDIDDDPWWEGHVERFAELRITAGCAASPARFCPDGPVAREHMAAFLVKAFSLPPGPDAGFVDVAEDNVFGPAIDALANSGITAGCATDPPRYCTTSNVSREQMATFLSRAISREPEALSVAIESTAPRFVDGSFDVTITFSQPVTGLESSDIAVVNGTATNLAGAGAAYTATIEPAADGTVMVRVPAAGAQSKRGAVNASSDPFVRTQDPNTEIARLGIDTWDRSAVLRGYRQEFEREEPDWGYTGDVDQCVAGTTSQDFRDSVLRRVNWYRRMAGLATVAEDPALTATAQRKALIMLAQGALSHTPSPDWACYSDIDHPGENLGLGHAGVRGVDGYMQDSGDNNRAVGHRLQILSPLVVRIGTGNVRDGDRRFGVANAMHLDYDFNLVPAAREVRGLVAWPPPGYVSAPAVWGRWSFSRQRIETEVNRVGNTIYTRWFLSGPDFSRASVAVSDDNGPVPTEIIHRDGALVWAVNGDTRSAPWPEPADDHCYTVTISGVRVSGAVQAPYEYAVCVLGPER